MKMNASIVTATIVGNTLFGMVTNTWAFQASPLLTTISQRPLLSPAYMFFADTADDTTATESTATPKSSVNVQVIQGSEASIDNAAKFMVDAFWLQSPQQLFIDASDTDVSDAVKSTLINTQADDLQSKYGERMGSRKLDALILVAGDGIADRGELLTLDNVQGLVTIEIRLLDSEKDLLSAKESEFKLTQAVASLGPKQRREYKDASVIDIANQLLPVDVKAVCSLSNLCVSPSARRQGIARTLCAAAEAVAKNELGFDDMYLRVEKANDAAKRLYEDKLGYENVFDIDNASVLRVDAKSGSFQEVESDIVVLKKKI